MSTVTAKDISILIFQRIFSPAIKGMATIKDNQG